MFLRIELRQKLGGALGVEMAENLAGRGVADVVNELRHIGGMQQQQEGTEIVFAPGSG